MKITFLKAPIPLTKTFTKTAQGIEKSSYPNVYEVTSIEEDCPNLKTLAALLTKYAALGYCMLKGNVNRALISESRAGTTDPNAPTLLALFDIDGLTIKTPNEFMKLLGLSDVSYVVQYSASYKITDELLRCHIFAMLSEEQAAPLLKQHLIALNFEIKLLKESLSLTKTGNALRYGLDITTCQNDKLIYIANPTCIGFKAPVTKRIEYIKKKRETFTFNSSVSAVVNKAQIEKHIAELRERAKLPARKNTYKLINNVEVLVKPDQSIITGMKEERGFVYFNLNGGDSWAYYHPSNNPDFIHNFKGEPVYQTKELLPEYWQQVCAARKSTPLTTSPTVKDTTFLAFLDKRSGAYHRGTYDKGRDALDLYMAKNETQVRHFAVQNGFALPDFIPEWEMVFDPHAAYRVDTEAQRVNTFQPTEYMQKKSAFVAKKGAKTYPTIQKIVHHALGSRQEITDYFINWLAFIAQKLTHTRTAWILHGRTGTGKGLLINNIITPLFGAQHVATKRMEELAEPYNAYMDGKFFVFIDEVQTSVMQNEKSIMAKIKNFITEPTISLRKMYEQARPVGNYTNWIFASNMPDPVAVDMNDRRFNVGRYQEAMIQITQEEVESIPNQLQAFYNMLMAYQVDELKASTPLDTDDRRNLMNISEASIDSVSKALIEGNFEFFLDQLPTNAVTNNVTLDLVEDYKAALARIINRFEDGDNGITRDELRAIYEWTVGDMPKSPNKFTSRLKHHRVHTYRIRIAGISVHGYKVTWQSIPADARARLSGKPQLVKTDSRPATGKSKTEKT